MVEIQNSTEPERGQFSPLFLWTGLAVTGLLLSQFAFSGGVRNQILERDGHKCVVCGSTEHLEAAHKNHSRGKNYNHPEMGRTLCSACHLDEHQMMAGLNGLSKAQNDWAIQMLEQRVSNQD
jgi:hypothetical protein